MLIYHPDAERWKALVKGRKIRGTLKQAPSSDPAEGTEITIGPLTAKDLRFITADEQSALFDWGHPTAFIKLTK